MTDGTRTGWLDVSAGVAGDMLLGALVDAGASLDFIRAQVDGVLPGAITLSAEPVTRAGLRATKISVIAHEPAPVPRTWRDIRELLTSAPLLDTVRDSALLVFGQLAAAEARAHGIEAAAVHFHEVGALDSIADVVGCCAAIADLQLDSIVASRLALGSGSVDTEHGRLPVPVPAVLELVRGWTATGGAGGAGGAGGVGAGAEGEPGELATPTGAALVTTLASQCGPMPPMRVTGVGIGAGRKDFAGHANVVRVVIGTPAAAAPRSDGPGETQTGTEVVLEANVDDLDPRSWPAVLAALLAAGARDAWLTPILMKKGRPAHTLHVLAEPPDAATLGAVIIAQTSTIGLRSYEVSKYALARTWLPVEVDGQLIQVKVAHEGGVIRQATPEYADVEAAAGRLGRPVRQVLRQAEVAAAQRGLTSGQPLPS